MAYAVARALAARIAGMVTAGFLGATLAALPASAQADLTQVDGQTVIESITAAQLTGLLQAEGYEASFKLLDDGTPYIESKTLNMWFGIFLYGCDGTAKAKSCSQIIFQTWFTPTKPATAELLNDYDTRWAFGKAYVAEDGAAMVEHQIYMYGGVTVDNIVTTLRLWDEIITNFLSVVDS